MQTKLVDMFKNKTQPVGTIFFVGNPALAECLAISGIDYIIVDMEHGPFDIESTADIIRAAELHGTPVLARVKDDSRSSILKALDIGVRGLIVPNVHSVEQLNKIVEHAKYFPVGMRGMAGARAAGYSLGADIVEYMRESNKRTMLIPQCETKGCLENIEEIVQNPSVSGIFIGPFDLSVALGKPAQFDTPEFIAAIERILRACKQANKYCINFSLNIAGTRKAFEQGFDSVVFGVDSGVYIQAFRKILSEIKK